MPDPKDSMAQNRGRQAVQRKLYTEDINEEDEEEERGKTVQAGNFVYILSMSTKRVTDQNVLNFSKEA